MRRVASRGRESAEITPDVMHHFAGPAVGGYQEVPRSRVGTFGWERWPGPGSFPRGGRYAEEVRDWSRQGNAPHNRDDERDRRKKPRHVYDDEPTTPGKEMGNPAGDAGERGGVSEGNRGEWASGRGKAFPRKPEMGSSTSMDASTNSGTSIIAGAITGSSSRTSTSASSTRGGVIVDEDCKSSAASESGSFKVVQIAGVCTGQGDGLGEPVRDEVRGKEAGCVKYRGTGVAVPALTNREAKLPVAKSSQLGTGDEQEAFDKSGMRISGDGQRPPDGGGKGVASPPEAKAETGRSVTRLATSGVSASSGGGRGREVLDKRPELLTYVLHDKPQSTLSDEEDCGDAGKKVFDQERDMQGKRKCSGLTPAFRRLKRPRQDLKGASARAVVWAEPCAACRGGSGVCAAGDANGDVEMRGVDPEADPSSRRHSVEAGAGEGAVKPGQYVYLRPSTSEDVQRSLLSDGEFAPPEPDGVFHDALEGSRILVWRGATEEDVPKCSGASRPTGAFAEADVVKFDGKTGKHRVRFVEDEKVEDVRLLRETGDRGGGSEGSDGSGEHELDGVRWLQTRTRPRRRDLIRRNIAGLGEGPGGEMTGFIGDEFDPPPERRENWRWAMGRWRWELGERDWYGRARDQVENGERGAGSAGGERTKRRVKGDRASFEEQATVTPIGDGMFPPIGRVLAVERRYLDTGKQGPVSTGSGRGAGEADGTGVFLKVARLWYPQDTRSGMDPFIHGKAEVFEACRVVVGDEVQDLSADGSGRTGDRSGGCHGDCKRDVSESGSCSNGGASSGGETSHRSFSPYGCSQQQNLGVGRSRGRKAKGGPLTPSRLDAGRPLEPYPRLEPIVSWVRACEARQLASVHPCLDGRLNPCAGKVVNDPHQAQAEFFLSHRYCLELDAYFPLESVNKSLGSGPGLGPVGRSDGGEEHGAMNARMPGDHKRTDPSSSLPRSTKERLLQRGASGVVHAVPPKCHPLKKRMSHDHSVNSGGGRDSPVIGREATMGWGTRHDAGTCVSGTAAFGGAVGGPPPAEVAVNGTPAPPFSSRDAQFFLCHRCRHALPSRNLKQCHGRECTNFFCATCAAGCAEGSRVGGTGLKRHQARWPEAGLDTAGGSARSGTDKVAAGGDEDVLVPWTGPCCEGLCDCLDCAADADEGLLSAWNARVGQAHFCNLLGGTRPESGCVAASSPAIPQRGVAMEFQGWHGRRESKEALDALRVVKKEVTSGVEIEGEGVDAVPSSDFNDCVAEEALGDEEEESENDDGWDVEVKTEWCSSCGRPGSLDSLVYCYYCRGGVHATGCRRFEEALTSQRLVEFGVELTGQILTPPVREAAVGHGIALCIRGVWRPARVLCWSPILGAHYVRYVDKETQKENSALDDSPWGEWVLLPASPNAVRPDRGTSSGGGRARRSSIAVTATSARWAMVEVVHSLRRQQGDGAPGVLSGSSSAATAADVPAVGPAVSSSPPPPRQSAEFSFLANPEEGKKAVKILKRRIKNNWLATQASSREADADGGEAAGGASKKYCPPAVSLPRFFGEQDVGHGEGDESNPENGPRSPWVCRSCMEGKLRRLQRRVRGAFLAPEDTPKTSRSEGDAPATPGGRVSAELKNVTSPAVSVTDVAPLPPPSPQPPKSPTSVSVSASLSDVASVVEGIQPPAEMCGSVDSKCYSGREDGGLGEGAIRRSEEDGFEVTSPSASRDDASVEQTGRSEGSEASEASVEDPVVDVRATIEKGMVQHNGILHLGMAAGADPAIEAAEVETEVEAVGEAERDVDAGADAVAKAEAASRRKEARRRARADSRLRWLSGGSLGSTRPFAYEAGFVSDLIEMHANGALSATGASTGMKRGTLEKRPRPAPPVARAMAHTLSGLDTQRPVAFTLPSSITNLDKEVKEFLSDGAVGIGAASSGGAGGGGVSNSETFHEQGLERSLVLVKPEAAVPPCGPRVTCKSTKPSTSAGPGSLFLRPGKGGARRSMPVDVPAEFCVKEVELESCARVRSLDMIKQRRMRPSNWGGSSRNSSGRLRMSSSDTSTSVAAGSLATGDRTPGGTTLKDSSRKNRMQRVDQRHMRRHLKDFMSAGLLSADVLQSRRKKLRFERSLVHAWGVFADEPIAAGDFVIEYRGEIIGNAVADKREKMYEQMQIGSDYMFRVDEDTVVDATFKGSLARFINHSCDPCCTTRIIVVDGTKKIVIYAERDVAMGEELSYDYKFPLEPDEESRVPCLCGSEKCRGFIN